MNFLKYFLVLVFMCVCSFLIYDNVSAFTYSINVNKHSDHVFGDISQSVHPFGNQGGGRLSIDYNYLNHTITCNTPTCGVEYYYSATFNTDNSSSFSIFANTIQLDSNNYPVCTVSNNTASCIVNNNTLIKGLSMIFTYSSVNTSWTINSILIGTYTVYDISNSTSDIILNQNENQQQTNDRLDDLNDNLTNSSTDNPSSDFNSFNNKTATNGTITDLITLPISLFTNILNNVNGTCSSYSLGNMFGTNIVLPCINVSNYVGSNLWSVIDILFSGLFVLVISKKMIKVFENFSSMEEGDILD